MLALSRPRIASIILTHPSLLSVRSVAGVCFTTASSPDIMVSCGIAGGTRLRAGFFDQIFIPAGVCAYTAMGADIDNVCYYMAENTEISVASFVMIFKSYWFG
jgi:hypothetical protein